MDDGHGQNSAGSTWKDDVLEILIKSKPLSLALSLIFFFFLFRAAPVALGDSQSGGGIGAAAEDYTTATATTDLRCICDLCHSLWQHQILNPLSEARDQTHILTKTSATKGTP